MPARKVTILGGAGGVGASTAFNLLLTWDRYEIVLVDTRPNMLTSHLMDFDQVLEQSPGCTIRVGEIDDVRDADVVVMISGTPLTAGTPRLEYLARNARIADDLLATLGRGWGGTLIVITNPVDPLVTRLQRRGELDRRRVVGYTLNDTLRLRTGFAKALGVPAGSVEAWVLGEHGDRAVPLLDRVRVEGRRLDPSPEQAAAAVRYFRTWYPIHVALDSGRSSTWTSGLGVARMIAALDDGGGEGELWPASVVLEGEYGIDGVAVTVPITLARGGATKIHEWDLGPANLAALRASAEFVRAAVIGIEGIAGTKGDDGVTRIDPIGGAAASLP